MGGNVLIIILAAALVFAIAVVFYQVGRIAYAIGHYYLKERQPPRSFHSPEFGTMTGEDGTWQGEVTRDGREIPFVLEGTETQPDDQHLEQLRQLLTRFPQEEKRALDFLRQHEPELAGCALELYAVSVGDKLAAQDFELLSQPRWGERTREPGAGENVRPAGSRVRSPHQAGGFEKGSFVFEFISDRNDDRVWRVAFKNGEPASSGFDD